MPTILVLLGWRLFFYANEGNEPIHVHCRKGDIECKYWIDVDNFDIQEAYSYGMTPRDKKEIRKIIFQHFDYIGLHSRTMARISNEALGMNKLHQVEDVNIENGILSINIDGKVIQRNLKDISGLLERAKSEELNEFDISPSGYGIYWPLIDEDISIDGLLGIEHHPHSNRKSA